MAIVNFESNAAAMTLNYIASRLNTTTSKTKLSGKDEQGFCPCDCGLTCSYEELAFANTGGADYTKDKSSFLYRVFDASDTVVIKLTKNGEEIETITDDTFGIYYPLGGLTAQPLYSGFIVDWSLVYDTHGAGKYTIKATATVFTVPTETESRVFNLVAWNERRAHNTVKIESLQNGCIFNSDFDYTDLKWPQSFRISGRFGNKRANIEIDEYQDENRRRQQLQDKITNTYTLETGLLISDVSNKIIYDNFLANNIYITDYNLLANEIYRKFEVRMSEITETEYFRKNNKGLFEFEFTDIDDNIIKRNVK